MSYIYKITNIINNKIYVGYTSRTLSRRLYEHIWEAEAHKGQDSALHAAIFKYGKENFQIEEIYEFDENEEEWQNLEQYFIKELNSLVPNGYNILQGGDKPPIHYGNANNKIKVLDEDLPRLIEMLKNNKIPYDKIAKEFNISKSELYCINRGETRYNSNISYPIRKYDVFEERALKVIEMLQTDFLSLKDIAEEVGIRTNEVASINTGKLYGYLYEGQYPVRNFLVPNNYKEKQQTAKQVVDYIKTKKEKNEKVTQKGLQQELSLGRVIVEKIVKGIYPYKLSGENYPLF